jgi:hypothetical protein
MTTLITIRDDNGKITRRCDARCHRSDPLKPSSCLCNGMLKGIERDGHLALDVPPMVIQIALETIRLKPGEHVQLRLSP